VQPASHQSSDHGLNTCLVLSRAQRCAVSALGNPAFPVATPRGKGSRARRPVAGMSQVDGPRVTGQGHRLINVGCSRYQSELEAKRARPVDQYGSAVHRLIRTGRVYYGQLTTGTPNWVTNGGLP